MPVHISFGAGVSGRAADFIEGTNVVIVCDPFLYKNGTAKQIGDKMKGKNVFYFSDIQPNPSGESVDAATAIARENKADCIVGIGGGSSLDVAKIVSCLVTNEGSIYDYYSGGTKKLAGRNGADPGSDDGRDRLGSHERRRIHESVEAYQDAVRRQLLLG